jgi:hypothetical protein
LAGDGDLPFYDNAVFRPPRRRLHGTDLGFVNGMKQGSKFAMLVKLFRCVSGGVVFLLIRKAALKLALLSLVLLCVKAPWVMALLGSRA